MKKLLSIERFTVDSQFLVILGVFRSKKYHSCRMVHIDYILNYRSKMLMRVLCYQSLVFILHLFYNSDASLSITAFVLFLMSSAVVVAAANRSRDCISAF